MSATGLAPKVALCFVNFGPYHLARLAACRREIERYAISGVEMARRQQEYGWASAPGDGVRTVVTDADLDELPAREWAGRVATVLDELQPACCAAAGYSHPSMRAVIEWCNRRRRPAILMSDSTAWDSPRAGWKEWIKGRLAVRCSAALAAGEPHAEYLATLGLRRDRIALGYDVVDNVHFGTGAAAVRGDAERRRRELGLPRNFFLASARFVAKKNLAGLLRAFAEYRRQTTDEAGGDGDAWDLVLLGDGPLRGELESQRTALGLDACVHLPGFKQYDELPAYYGLAGAFVHASTVEQWGLVVNEALAAGLPAIVSARCGCASTLVREGENGFTFDPHDEGRLAGVLRQLAGSKPAELARMGQCGAEIVAAWGPSRFAEGLAAAADIALRAGPTARQPWGSLIDRALTLAGR